MKNNDIIPPYSMKCAKKKNEDKNKISINEGYFFEQPSLVIKSPTATDINLNKHKTRRFDHFIYSRFLITAIVVEMRCLYFYVLSGDE